MDQKRPYNDIPNGDTAPVPPVSGDTVPLPAPGEGTPAPETDKAAPENGAVSRDRQGCPGAGEEAGREKSKKESAARKAFPRHVPGRAHRARRRRRRHIHRG